jgi:hypothetical protein
MTPDVESSFSKICKLELDGKLLYQKQPAEASANTAPVSVYIYVFSQFGFFPSNCLWRYHFANPLVNNIDLLIITVFPLLHSAQPLRCSLQLFHKLSPYFQQLVLNGLVDKYTTLQQFKEDVLYLRYVSVSSHLLILDALVVLFSSTTIFVPPPFARPLLTLPVHLCGALGLPFSTPIQRTQFCRSSFHLLPTSGLKEIQISNHFVTYF